MLKTHYNKNLIEAGCDEAGRGCLAGPVVAAAVIFPKDFSLKDLNDSKILSDKKRRQLRPIIEKEAISWAVTFIDHQTIDKINILQASILAMHQSLDKLETKPELILVDGNKFKTYKNIKHICIVKGDSTYQSIAAASVLAKTYRDDYMINIHNEYPQYHWNSNKGYASKQHVEAIVKYGYSPHHRKSFHLKMQINLPFTD